MNTELFPVLTNYEWSCYKDTISSAPTISLGLSLFLFSKLCSSVIYSKGFSLTPLFETALLITLWSLISRFTTCKCLTLPSFTLHFLQQTKTEIILVRGLQRNRDNRICLYTDTEEQPTEYSYIILDLKSSLIHSFTEKN